MSEEKYNPYKDSTIHFTVPSEQEDPDALQNREAFNDVIRHYDHVNGFQSPKRLDGYPRPLKIILKSIIIFVAMFALAFIGNIFNIINFLRW